MTEPTQHFVDGNPTRICSCGTEVYTADDNRLRNAVGRKPHTCAGLGGSTDSPPTNTPNPE